MRIVILLLALLIIFKLSSNSTPLALKDLKLDTKYDGQKALCSDSKGCLGIYVTPWCSACKSILPFFNQLANSKSPLRSNLVAVVGSDSAENITAFSNLISGNVFLDIQGSFAELTKYSSVPRWFVINDKQEITDSFTLYRIPDGSAEEQLSYLIGKYTAVE